jgi:hypothetical protein
MFDLTKENMNWHQVIGILAGIIQIAAIVPYIKDTLNGETRPNIVSWGLWTLIQLIGIWILLASPDGYSWPLVFLCATTFNTASVVVLCLLGYGSREFGKLEFACLVIALIAIIIWITSNDPLLALSFDISADLVAAVPTLVKTWREPRSEAVVPWAMVSLAAGLGALSTTIVNVENLVLPIYLALVNGAIALVAYVGQSKAVNQHP